MKKIEFTFLKKLALLSYFLFFFCIDLSFSYKNDLIAVKRSPFFGEPNCSQFSEAYQASISAAKSGKWADASTWQGGVVPGLTDDVTIPSGMTITLNGSSSARYITINGILKPESNTSNVQLQAERILAENNGEFQIGTATQLFAGTFVITLNGQPTSPIHPTMGTKFIAAGNNGKIEFHGENRLSWTNLSETANIGSNIIKLKVAVNWEVGEEIVLTSTDLASGGGWDHTDKATITAISADKKTITLNRNLTYRHVGGTKSYTRAKDGKTWNVDIFGEVALLSHNIKIQGNVTTTEEAVGFGGHMMFMKGSTVHIENVELFQMGQLGVLGRYPIHWHLMENTATGHYVRNSSIHKSFNRAVTVHATDYATIEGVVAFDHIGHGFFLENSGERFNTFKNNLVFSTRRPAKGKELTPSDNEFDQAQNRTPSSYWITNPNNIFEGNVAAGTEGTGFWFVFSKAVLNDSKIIPYYQNINSSKEPLGSFKNFVAHSCMNGFDLFDQLNQDHSILTNWGWSINVKQYVDNGLFYANDQAIYCGLDVSGDPNMKVFRNCVFSDNKLISMLAADLVLENCLFNVNTDLNVFTGERWFFWFYDGPGYHDNCHFVGWNRTDARLVKPSLGVGATTHPSATFRNCTRAESENYRFEFKDFSINQDMKALSLFFRDYTGGFTGKAHTTVVPNHPFFVDGHEYVGPDYKNAARSDYYFANNQLFYDENIVPDFTLSRTKPGQPTVYAQSLTPDGGGVTFSQFPAIMDQGYTYNLSYYALPSKKYIKLSLYRGEKDGSFVKCFKHFGALAGLTVTGSGITAVNSLLALNSSVSEVYFIDANKDLYIKRVYTMTDNNDRQEVRINWTGDGTFFSYPEVDSDGDGMSDKKEIEIDRNPLIADDLNFEFNTNADFEGWTVFSNTSNQQVQNGSLNGTAINNGDANVTNNKLNFKSEEVKIIKVIVKSTVASSVQLFFGTNTAGISAAQSLTQNYTNVGNWQVMTFNVGAHSLWKGFIKSLRIDPTSVLNANFEISAVLGSDDFDGDGISDEKETSLCRNVNSAADLNFGFSNSNEGFTKTNIAADNLSSTTHWLLRNDKNPDPYIYKSGLFIDGNQITNLQVRVQSEAVGNFQLYWETLNEPNYSEQKSVSASYTGGGFKILTFDLSNNLMWKNQSITSLRLDFPGKTDANSHTWLDYIKAQSASDAPCVVSNVEKFDEISTESNLIVTPNPSLGIVKIIVNFNISEDNVKVYSMSGIEVDLKDKVNQISDKTLNINLINEPSGVYLIETTDKNGGVLTEKIWIK